MSPHRLLLSGVQTINIQVYNPSSSTTISITSPTTPNQAGKKKTYQQSRIIPPTVLTALILTIRNHPAVQNEVGMLTHDCCRPRDMHRITDPKSPDLSAGRLTLQKKEARRGSSGKVRIKLSADATFYLSDPVSAQVSTRGKISGSFQQAGRREKYEQSDRWQNRIK